MKKLHGAYFDELGGNAVLVIRENVAGIARDESDMNSCLIVTTGGVEFHVRGTVEDVADALKVTLGVDS